MIDQTQATQLAAAWLAEGEEPESRMVLLTERTTEYSFGWVFFYTSAAYLRTNAISDLLAGNAPIVVDRTGGIHVTGTAYPLEQYFGKLAKEMG